MYSYASLYILWQLIWGYTVCSGCLSQYLRLQVLAFYTSPNIVVGFASYPFKGLQSSMGLKKSIEKSTCWFV